MKLTFKQFSDLIDNKTIMSGDLICIETRDNNLIQFLITNIQLQLLINLYPNMNKNILIEFSKFTYIAIIINPTMVVEMYPPIGTFKNINELFQGESQILIKRPIFLHEHYTIEDRGDKISNLAIAFIKKSPKYNFLELLRYYFWALFFNRLILGKTFIDIFKDKKYNTCSGFCWEMCVKAESIDISKVNNQDIFSESWFPARLAFDNEHFKVVGVFDIINL